MKKYILFLAVFLFNLSSFSQSKIEKYWYYRKRLTDYFVKVGPNIGESIVAERLNDGGYNKYKIGDGTIDLASYISVLATEYALLIQNNQNTNETLQELYYAMLAYERLDRCEDQAPWYQTEELDGFFNRWDVELFTDPSTFSLEGRNKGLTPNDDWGTKPPGHPTWINALDDFEQGDPEISQDQAVHLLMGFALIKRGFNDEGLSFTDLNGNIININFYSWALQLTDKIINYIKDGGWLIWDPNHDLVPRGANAIGNSFGLAEAGQYITGTNYHNVISIADWPVWWMQRIPNPMQPYNTTMAMGLAAIGDSWNFLTTYTDENLLIAGFPWDRQDLYVPLYSYLHSRVVGWPTYKKNKIRDILDDAPCGGPYFWSNSNEYFSCCGSVPGNPGGGWATKNRFRNDIDGQYNGADKANFNGLDYMLLYNLYHLKENPTPYVDLRKRYFSESLPQTYVHIVNSEAFDEIETGSLSHPLTIQALSEIESTAKLDNLDHRTRYYVWRTKIWIPTPTWSCLWCGHWKYIVWYSETTYADIPTKYGDLRLKAPDRIVLKPGFLVKNGSHFLAKIESNYCNSSLYKNLPYVTAYDSAHWNNLKPDLIERDSTQMCRTPDLNSFNSTETSNLNNIEIYPNPTKREITVNSDAIIEKIEISNISGTIVRTIQVNNYNFKTDISELSNGVYLLKLISDTGEIYVEKLIKQ